MSDDGTPPAAPRVGVYALIGRDDRLLLIGGWEPDDVHVLPGGLVAGGEAVEEALRRMLIDQLGARVEGMDFCAVVERDIAEAGGRPGYEVAFLFDVTLVEGDHPAGDRFAGAVPRRCWWAGEHELSSLRPEVIRDGLVAGTLSAENPWWVWTP